MANCNIRGCNMLVPIIVKHLDSCQFGKKFLSQGQPRRVVPRPGCKNLWEWKSQWIAGIPSWKDIRMILTQIQALFTKDVHDSLRFSPSQNFTHWARDNPPCLSLAKDFFTKLGADPTESSGLLSLFSYLSLLCIYLLSDFAVTYTP